MAEPKIRVLCVDDNDFIAEAIMRSMRPHPEFEWLGWLPTATGLAARVREFLPTVIVMDVDMPGENAFEAVALLAAQQPQTRVLMLSGHARRDLVDRAVASGAWGYVSKDEDLSTVLDAVRRVAAGEFVLGPEAEKVYIRSDR